MGKMIKIKSGWSHQLYLAVFASVLVLSMFLFFFILAIVCGWSVLNSLVALYPFVYPLIGVWLIFFILRLSCQLSLEVNESFIIKKFGNKIKWQIAWEEIEKIEFFKMPWNYFLSPNVYAGNLFIAFKVEDKLIRQKVNITCKDVKKINEIFGKNIIIR